MLALALDDACGEPISSRSRSSHAYAERIGGMGPEDDDERGGGGAECGAYRSGSESYMDNLRWYAATPSGPPPPSVHIHPGKGQCALCGRWFCRSIKDKRWSRRSSRADTSCDTRRSVSREAV